jgi:CheY-like chemotaxis protein
MSRTIIAVVDDLFFASKIRGTAQQFSLSVSFARTKDGLIEAALQERPALIICDLHSQKIDPIGLARDLKENYLLGEIPLVGFLSHVQVDLQKAAQAAGFDQVLPRSAFTKNLPQILAGTDSQD